MANDAYKKTIDGLLKIYLSFGENAEPIGKPVKQVNLLSGGLPAVAAATLGSKNLAARKCRHLENRLEPEGRSFVRLLRTRFTRLAR